MSKKLLLIALIAVLGLGLIAFLIIKRQPKDYRELMKLKVPRIITLEKQTMLVIKGSDAIEKNSGNAIATLFKIFFTLKTTTPNLRLVAPRARWTKPIETARSEWMGIFGLPLSESIAVLPEKISEEHPDVLLEEWTYGEISEILHVGPYSRENESINKLRIFVNERGYVLSDILEEEYIKGPDMFAKGNPEEYLTIIRYQITKAENAEIEPIKAKKIKK